MASLWSNSILVHLFRLTLDIQERIWPSISVCIKCIAGISLGSWNSLWGTGMTDWWTDWNTPCFTLTLSSLTPPPLFSPLNLPLSWHMTDMVHLQDNQSLIKTIKALKKWRHCRRGSQGEPEQEIIADSLYGKRAKRDCREKMHHIRGIHLNQMVD